MEKIAYLHVNLLFLKQVNPQQKDGCSALTFPWNVRGGKRWKRSRGNEKKKKTKGEEKGNEREERWSWSHCNVLFLAIPVSPTEERKETGKWKQ